MGLEWCIWIAGVLLCWMAHRKYLYDMINDSSIG